jgi:1-acyl-sn-glycerol-3-phosphate acyltransferase
MIVARSIVFNVVFYVTFAVLMLVGLPCLAMPRSATIAYVRMWARVSVWLLKAICGTRVEFRNLHLLPKGASILAVKHQSFLETFALITVLDDFTYILKKELTPIPFFGWYLMGTGQIAIDRSKKGGTLPQLQRSVRDKLAAGRQVVIFPEGTRRPVGVPPAYKVGVSVLVTDTGVTCTPVALNSGLFWPRRSFVRRPGTVVIEFLPPIPPGLGKRAFMQRLEQAIEPATDALVKDAYARDPGLAAIVAQETARRLAEGEGHVPAKRGEPPAPGLAEEAREEQSAQSSAAQDRNAQDRGMTDRAANRLTNEPGGKTRAAARA